MLLFSLVLLCSVKTKQLSCPLPGFDPAVSEQRAPQRGIFAPNTRYISTEMIKLGVKYQKFFSVIPLFLLSSLGGMLSFSAQDFPFFRRGRTGSRQAALTFAQLSELEGCLQTPPGTPLAGESSWLGWQPARQPGLPQTLLPGLLSAAVRIQLEAGSRKSRGNPGEFPCTELRPACQARFLAPCLSFSRRWLEATTLLVPARAGRCRS